MINITKIAIIAVVLLLSGCAAQQEITRFKGAIPNEICIAHHEAVRKGFLNALQDSLTSQGIQSRVIGGKYVQAHGSYQTSISEKDKQNCQAVMFYTANWAWDIAMYMRYANIWIAQGEVHNVIAQASYESRNGLDKFIDAREKVFELVDQMVGQS